jgi:hypothetical protein
MVRTPAIVVRIQQMWNDSHACRMRRHRTPIQIGVSDLAATPVLKAALMITSGRNAWAAGSR